MTTIKDIAKLAGVAPSTVSRVIANHPRISIKTKRQVRKIMEELDYHPNSTGRNLVRNSTQTIGIVLKDSSSKSMHNPFFPEVIRGISESLQSKGYSMSLTTGETEEEVYENVARMVRSSSVDGLILLYSKQDDEVVSFLREKDCSFVVIGKPTINNNNISYVDNDNIKVTNDITQYLINLGHKRLAFVGGDLKYQVNNDRLQGFINAMVANGFDYKKEDNIFLGIKYNEVNEIVVKLTESEDAPTGLVVVDDLTALSIMNACQKKGIHVPDDISVISFNNSVIAEMSSPPQTSVDIHSYQLGFEAANSVIEYIKDPKMMKKNILVPTTLVERESCKRKD